MSAQTMNEAGIALDANGIPIETWGGKFSRKFKENPFVPVLAGLTSVSLIVAGVKLRRKESMSMNHWLRIRVLMQGLTVVAVVGGSWWYGQMKHQKEAAASVAAAEQDKLIERLGFEARLKQAEEAERMEKEAEVQASKTTDASVGGGGKKGWFGWGRG